MAGELTRSPVCIEDGCGHGVAESDARPSSVAESAMVSPSSQAAEERTCHPRSLRRGLSAPRDGVLESRKIEARLACSVVQDSQARTSATVRVSGIRRPGS